ncbi:MAG: glycosyltransferase family 4 protein [Anaerolineae bacterium]|nr:glycosyltransferase family 4 protein [Anaerolineae bacterium]
MHLAINASELGRQRGGNESYIAGLLDGLAQLNPPTRITLLTCRWDPPASIPPVFHQTNVGLYRRLPFFLWQQTLALRRLKADWYLANFFLPPLLPCRGAVVVHDLSFRAHPEYFPRTVAWYMRWLTGRAVQQARRILTVSDFSRRELCRFYRVDPAKVVVVPNGVGADFRPTSPATAAFDQAALAQYDLTPPYILALGNIHPRKNLARLLAAYRCLKQQRGDVPALVWAGLPRWDSSELLTDARAADVILPGFIAQEDLPALYRQALMLVYPSLYEGFGLPPLEAMACGTPVVTSSTTSLPEVVADAALTVDPASTEAIAAAMAQLLADISLRRHLGQAGLERAAEFTWTRTAQNTLASLGDGWD